MLDSIRSILPLAPSIILFFLLEDNVLRNVIFFSGAIAIGGFLSTSYLIPVVAQYTLRRGICGRDLCKKGTRNESKDIPEALGLAAGVVYLICAICSQLFFAKKFGTANCVQFRIILNMFHDILGIHR